MILYRTAGPWGPGVGANLAPTQVDGNFWDLSVRLQTLELHPPEAVQIVSFSSVGNQFYVHMSDGTVQGPLTLPTIHWNFRGPWQPSTAYSRDDVIVGPNNAVYLVMAAHTSATTFDVGANDGAGQNYYDLLLAVPAAVLPPGGATAYVLSKASAADYSVQWVAPPVPFGGNTGQVLQKVSDSDNDATWNDLRLIDDLRDVVVTDPLLHGDYLRWNSATLRWVNAQSDFYPISEAPSWAPVVGDEGTFMVLVNGTTDTTITIPHDNTQDFVIGTELHIHQDGTGRVIILGETGVSLLKHASFSTALLGQYATATVKKTGSNEWRLFGLLAGA